jgi:NADH-quinone oxidoreductase subunit N
VDASFFPTSAEYLRVAPEMVLIIFGTILMLLEALAGEGRRENLAPVAMAGILIALGFAWVAGSGENAGTAFHNMIRVDGYGTFYRILVLVTGALAVLCSSAYLSRESADTGEFWALLLFALSGQSLLAVSDELIMIFIALEISSIASYVLAGYLRDDGRANEAAIKYFLLGSFATAFLLYGVAWVYGITGATNLHDIHRFLGSPASIWSTQGLAVCAGLMFIGFAFKVSAAPFQSWAPDVYQGAPAPVAAFLSAAPKAAAFAVFIRVFATAFNGISEHWLPILWVSALLTMVIGNFAALKQTNLKRLLAYSSVAHAGYIMVAITAHSEIGITAVMFYLASYVFVNMGTFAVVAHFARQGERYLKTTDLAGYAQRQPVVAAVFTILLFSLIGVPLTGGFFGKFYIFKAALDSKLIWLSVLGLLNSAVAAYYYLRIIVVMYFHEPGPATENVPEVAPGVRLALLASVVATLVLGIFPSFILNNAANASSSLLLR